MSETVDRLLSLALARLTRGVRDGLRDGLTIAATRIRYPEATKRFIEDQRSFLRQTEGIADTRKTQTKPAVRSLTAAGLSARHIADALGISLASVYFHRRKQKTV